MLLDDSKSVLGFSLQNTKRLSEGPTNKNTGSNPSSRMNICLYGLVKSTNDLRGGLVQREVEDSTSCPK